MSLAAGKRYLEETKVKAQEGQRARTEARLVQLKLIQLESRIVDSRVRELDRPLQEQTFLSLSSVCVHSPHHFIFPLTFPGFCVLCLYVTLSSHHALKRQRDKLRHERLK
jgi:hypothetical protein